MDVKTTFKCSTCGRKFNLSFYASIIGPELHEVVITPVNRNDSGCVMCRELDEWPNELNRGPNA